MRACSFLAVVTTVVPPPTKKSRRGTSRPAPRISAYSGESLPRTRSRWTGSPTGICAKQLNESEHRPQLREGVADHRGRPMDREDAVEQAPAQERGRGRKAERRGEALAEAQPHIGEDEDRDGGQEPDEPDRQQEGGEPDEVHRGLAARD